MLYSSCFCGVKEKMNSRQKNFPVAIYGLDYTVRELTLQESGYGDARPYKKMDFHRFRWKLPHFCAAPQLANGAIGSSRISQSYIALALPFGCVLRLGQTIGLYFLPIVSYIADDLRFQESTSPIRMMVYG
jgi:hypothetical protein